MAMGKIVKLEKDGSVPVLYSNKIGKGWFSCNGSEQMIFDPQLVHLVDLYKMTGNDEMLAKMLFHCYMKYGMEGNDFSALRDLEIEMVPKGSFFYIKESKGLEKVVITDKMSWLRA